MCVFAAPDTWLAAPLPPADRRSPLSLSALLCLSAPLYPAFLELDCAVNGVCLPGLSAVSVSPLSVDPVEVGLIAPDRAEGRGRSAPGGAPAA